MKKFLLIQSRDPYESLTAEQYFEYARWLHNTGAAVTVFLVQNAVLPLRPDAKRGALESVLADGIDVLADEFSLRERGIDSSTMVHGVRCAPVDIVVDRMAAGWTTLFV